MRYKFLILLTCLSSGHVRNDVRVRGYILRPEDFRQQIGFGNAVLEAFIFAPG